jgi:hypothetical protein
MLQLLKSWLRPSFGQTKTNLGMPPVTLFFSAYHIKDDSIFNFNKIPVVITSMSPSYPADVDYFPTYKFNNYTLNGTINVDTNSVGNPFPVIMSLSINLQEVRSPRNVEKFDLDAYKNGKLSGW